MSSTESVTPQDVIVCACGTQEYTARDALDAAVFRGELEEKWREFLCSVAAEKRADELELELDESAISAAAEEFRYRYDLITAEETEVWLANRGLTFDDFSNYFARQYCVGVVREGFAPEEIGYSSAAPELRELFIAELILCGTLEDVTTKLMWRLAARCAGKEPAAEAIAAEDREFFHRTKLQRAKVSKWLEKLGRDSEWLNEMMAMEAAYVTHCNRVLVPEARQRELVTSRSYLTRFEVEVIELESHDAAREALFCVREDGMSMEEVATEGRYPYRRADFLLEDIPPDGQQRLLGASAGQVLEPLTRGDGFELCRVINKVEPQLDDPMVKSRLDQRLLDRYFSDLTTKYTDRRLGASISVE
jgi:hypothetical protein